jgi:hypothetical protein
VQALFAFSADPLSIVDIEPPTARTGGAESSGDRVTPPRQPDRPARQARLAIRPSRHWKRILEAAIVTTKAVTLACAVDAVVNADSPRLRGKAIRPRAVGYTIGLFVVPTIWRLLPDRGRYPGGLDLAVTTPLMLDAVGNALGLYERAHLDDVVHFLNAAIFSGIAGALFAGQVEKPWHAAIAGTGASIAGETGWEIAEYVALKAGAHNMGLGYDDTMGDLIASTLGAIAGGLVTWLRMPRSKEERQRGWRHAVSGWRDAGDPLSIGGGRDTVADTASAAAEA